MHAYMGVYLSNFIKWAPLWAQRTCMQGTLTAPQVVFLPPETQQLLTKGVTLNLSVFTRKWNCDLNIYLNLPKLNILTFMLLQPYIKLCYPYA